VATRAAPWHARDFGNVAQQHRAHDVGAVLAEAAPFRRQRRRHATRRHQVHDVLLRQHTQDHRGVEVAAGNEPRAAQHVVNEAAVHRKGHGRDGAIQGSVEVSHALQRGSRGYEWMRRVSLACAASSEATGWRAGRAGQPGVGAVV
jgi:hypothetical protein